MGLVLRFALLAVIFIAPAALHSQVVGHKNLGVKKNFNNYKPFSSADTNVIVINYDSADLKIWGVNYLSLQTQLMNVRYNATDSSSVNQDVVNYFTVVFDSIIDPYKGVAYPPDSLGGIRIDTLIVPLIQVNHSGKNDTLEVQLNPVDSFGYSKNTILQNKVIINKILGGASSSSSTISYIKIPENYPLSSGIRFAVTVKYSGSKLDSCWFLYGCGTFVGTCDSSGPYTLAQQSNFSKILTFKQGFYANSFVLYNKYKASGLYPTDSGAELYEDCNNDSVFTPGIDGVSYFQNIDVFAMVSTIPLGIEEIIADPIKVLQNEPNPFNQTTVINYNLTRSSDVLFSLYDMTGRKIFENAYNEVAPGQHVIALSANEFSAGIYFYSFKVNGSIVTKKMIITQ